MARGNIAVTTSSRSGAALPAETTGDPTNDHTVVNNGHVLILVRNSSVDTARTVEFVRKREVDGAVAAVRSESVPFGETQLFGPFSTSDYGTALDINPEHADIKLRAIVSGS